MPELVLTNFPQRGYRLRQPLDSLNSPCYAALEASDSSLLLLYPSLQSCFYPLHPRGHFVEPGEDLIVLCLGWWYIDHFRCRRARLDAAALESLDFL